MSFSRLQWPCEEQETLNYFLKIERFKNLVTLAMAADQLYVIFLLLFFF